MSEAVAINSTTMEIIKSVEMATTIMKTKREAMATTRMANTMAMEMTMDSIATKARRT